MEYVKKPTTYIIVNGEELEIIPHKPGMKQGCLLSTFPFNIVHWVGTMLLEKIKGI